MGGEKYHAIVAEDMMLLRPSLVDLYLKGYQKLSSAQGRDSTLLELSKLSGMLKLRNNNPRSYKRTLKSARIKHGDSIESVFKALAEYRAAQGVLFEKKLKECEANEHHDREYIERKEGVEFWQTSVKIREEIDLLQKLIKRQKKAQIAERRILERDESSARAQCSKEEIKRRAELW